MEQPKIEQPKKETKEKRPKHEIELEKRPMPQEGESYDKWLERIGGDNLKIAEDLEQYQKPKKKEDWPLLIDNEASFLLNNKNLDTYFDRKKLEDELKKENPSIHFDDKKGEYQLKKELFQKPELYFHVLGEELKNKRKIVADRNFGVSLERWLQEAEKPEEEKVKEKEEKLEEKKEKKEPEKKKPLTLDEKIAQKEKELEEAGEKMAIYRPLGWFRKKPVVRDLGYYAGEAKMKDLKKEIEELKKERREKGKPAEKEEIKEEIKEPKTLPEEVPEEPTTEERLGAIDKSLKSVYGKIGYRTRKIREGGVLGRADLEKDIANLEKERDKLKERKKKIKACLAIEKRLKEIPKEIKEGGVLNQSKLEGEQRKLKKQLKKLNKKAK